MEDIEKQDSDSQEAAKAQTEEERSEEIFHRSEENFRRAEKIAKIGNWEWNIVTNEVTWSDEIYRIYGIDKHKVKPSFDIVVQTVASEDRDRFCKAVDAAVKLNEPFEGQYRMIGLVANERFVHTIGTVVRDEVGRPMSMFGIIQDITDRKQSERKLQESEAKFRSIFEQATDGIMMADPVRKRIIEANRAICEMLGYTREEIITLRIEDMHPKEELSRILDLFEKQVRGELSLTRDIPMLRKDGSIIYVDINATSITIGGNPCLIGIFRDITKQRAMETSLRDTQARFKAIFEQSNDGISVADLDGRYVMVNPVFCAMTGYTEIELLEMRVHDLLPPHVKPKLFLQIAVGMNDGVRESELRRKDGSTFYALISGRVLNIGEHRFVHGIVHDITERRLLEEERLKTQKLESIGTLAGGIAHDFNNLLQGVFGYISVAKMALGDKAKSAAMLDQAEAALNLTVNLTRQLLTFSKGGKPAKKLIGLAAVVENAVKFALSGSQTDYLLESAGNLRSVEADEGQLARVIHNIVLNASEAMAGSGSVKVMTRNAEILKGVCSGLPEGGSFVCIDIQDNGTGIAEQNLARIFDPYFTTKQKGSGLGLATAYSIIKNHGGMIEVRSELNNGTIFTIYLPAATEIGIQVETTVSVKVRARKCRILLMDDEHFIRIVASEMITVLGHEVQIAEDGKKAIEIFRQAKNAGKPFDLLIFDLTVKGGMGGDDAIKKIRELDADVKAVVSSGYGDSPVIANYRSHGFSAFLNKPYDIHALENCLNELAAG
ncbi:MAG: PAS domain S-box protein [Candidatus Riflebacteria bacterium]|nr:PAS domain S-box protein [Candidatus Riflebacteria bacterium]